MPVVTKYVSIRQPKGLVASFTPGDELPEWAIPLITNPAVLAESPAAATGDEGGAPAGANTTPPAASAPPAPSRQELVDKAKSLGIKANQSNDVLIAAIAAKEAEQSTPADASTGKETEGGDAARPELEAKAKELGIEFTAETSDAELELAIAGAGTPE